METKVCSKCGKEKPITEFAFRDKAKGTRRAECKECISNRQKVKYHAHKEELNDYKKQCKCAKCGESRFYLLDFHHVDPSNKVETVARLSTSSSMERTWEEIKKCICLCANCHREFHYCNDKFGTTLQDYLKDDFVLPV